jgi:hypothetical protein
MATKRNQREGKISFFEWLYKALDRVLQKYPEDPKGSNDLCLRVTGA